MVVDVRDALEKGAHEVPPGWTWEWFTDVMDVEGGTQPPAATFVDSPRSGYVRLVQIRDFETDAHLTYIPDSHKWRKCSKADVLIGRYGAALGRICTGLSGAYNVALAKVVPSARLHQRFVYYLLTSRYFQAPLIASGARSAQAGFNKDGLAVIPLPIPAIAEQKRIAHILGTLDDKIKLNRRINATLESMSRAIFKSWFVDFDPVRQKAAAKQPFGMDAKTAALFPDSFEDSAIGEVPMGWGATVLGDVLEEIETGGRPKGGVSSYSSGVPSIGAESIVGLGAFDYAKTKFVPREFYDKMTKGRVQSRDVLLYKDGGRPGQFEPHVTLFGDGFPFAECGINEHVYRLRSQPAFGQALLYFWLSSDFVMEEMRVKGTGVAIPGLNSTQAKSLTTLRPSPEVARAFNERVEPEVARVLSNCNESRTLARLRDTLLPKLLSGEIRVPEAEQAVEEATA